MACTTCRVKKVKCDHQKPSCSYCQKHQTTCVYESSRYGRRQSNSGIVIFLVPDLCARWNLTDSDLELERRVDRMEFFFNNKFRQEEYHLVQIPEPIEIQATPPSEPQPYRVGPVGPARADQSSKSPSIDTAISAGMDAIINDGDIIDFTWTCDQGSQMDNFEIGPLTPKSPPSSRPLGPSSNSGQGQLIDNILWDRDPEQIRAHGAHLILFDSEVTYSPKSLRYGDVDRSYLFRTNRNT
ncbi:MAG: hypothetical protein M1819_000929 [Sarea resinae]|nr:MAG: hypothetical protein M1819_000929 [Sarea resinae]